MRESQRGMTLIGWVMVLIVIGVFALAGIKLVPVYMENLKVVTVLKGVKSELDGQKATPATIRKSLRSRWQVEDINVIKHSDVKIEQSKSGGYTVHAAYDHRTSFIGNIGLIAAFDHVVEIRR